MSTPIIVVLSIVYVFIILFSYYGLNRWLYDYLDDSMRGFDIFFCLIWPLTIASVTILTVGYGLFYLLNKFVFLKIEQLANKGRNK